MEGRDAVRKDGVPREDAAEKAMSNVKVRIAIFGIDNAGKTSLVHAMGGHPVCTTAPTMGFVPTNFVGGGFDLSLFDLGGAGRFRSIWRNYYADIHGLIFVIDASDWQRFDEARTALKEILADARAIGKPLLIVSNKQDRPDTIPLATLIERLELHMDKELYQAIECVAIQEPVDASIDDGTSWLLETIAEQYEKLSDRIKEQMAQDRVESQKRKTEQRLRVQKAKRAAYVHDTKVHYMFEHLAGKLLTMRPAQPLTFLRSELELLRSKHVRVRIAVLGTQNAGKTTIVKRITEKSGHPPSSQVSTPVFTPFTLNREGWEAVLYDFHTAEQGTWAHHLSDLHGLIFVVDCSGNEATIAASKDALSHLRQDFRTQGKPILVVGNKSDCVPAEDLVTHETLWRERLGLTDDHSPTETPREHNTGTNSCILSWTTSGAIIQNPDCCGGMDESLESGVHWLLGCLAERFHAISVRILQHMTQERQSRALHGKSHTNSGRCVAKMSFTQPSAMNDTGENPFHRFAPLRSDHNGSFLSRRVENSREKTRQSGRDSTVHYAKTHQIHHLFEHLASRLLEERPDNIPDFLLEELNTAKDRFTEETSAAK